MPRDVSSSSEDEADSPASGTETQAKAPEKTMSYQCPADFVSFSHKTCSSTLMKALKKNHAELWLIKAPSSFNPERFRGLQVPLSGLQTLKVPSGEGGASTGSDHQIYSVLASTHSTSDLRLLTKARRSSDNATFGPTFSGLLNVCETYGDANANQTPQVVPAAPAPTIPSGLKQRFHPFGSKTPTLTCVAESEADGAAYGPSSTTLRPLVMKRFVDETRAEEEDEEGRRRKNKKKKEKRIKTEPVDDVDALIRVKTEPAVALRDEMMAELFHFQEDATATSDERRKKKKKKKDQEREEVEEGLEPSLRVKQEEVTVKCEPVDASYGDVVDGKKKKKKKKKKSDDY